MQQNSIRSRPCRSLYALISYFLFLAPFPSFAVTTPAPIKCVEDIRSRYPKDEIQKAQLYVSTHDRNGTNESDYQEAQGLLQASDKIDEKIRLIYKAARDYDMPPQFLLGVLVVESDMIDDGIDVDGGNYSCGISQLDLQEWCNWAQTVPTRLAHQMHWPQKELRNYQTAHHLANVCDSPLFDNTGVKVMMEKVQALHPGKPLHEIDPAEAVDMSLNRFQEGLDQQSERVKEDLPTLDLRYQVTRSFLKSCRRHTLAIPALASVLRHLYDEYVPLDLINSDRFQNGGTYQGNCQEKAMDHFYPISPSWILTSGIYNGGEEILYGISRTKQYAWNQMQAKDLIIAVEAILAGTEYYQKVRFDWEVVGRYMRKVLSFETSDVPGVAPVTRPELRLFFDH